MVQFSQALGMQTSEAGSCIVNRRFFSPQYITLLARITFTLAAHCTDDGSFVLPPRGPRHRTANVLQLLPPGQGENLASSHHTGVGDVRGKA